jgi:uridine kinase
MAASPPGNPVLIAIAGGSGSGKTWLARHLSRNLPGRVEIVCLDAFYRDRSHLPPGRRARCNFDHPRALDRAALETAIREARAGRTFAVPVYDYAAHARIGTRPCRPDRFVIFEGLWPLLSPRLRRLFDLKIFIEAGSDWRLARRLERDVGERGRTPDSIIQQFREQVDPMHRIHVEPQHSHADLVFNAPVTDGDADRALAEARNRRRQKESRA